LAIRGRRLILALMETAELEVQRKARRWGQATAHFLRNLLTSWGPVDQVASARELKVSQPRVSQIVRLLAKHGVDVDQLDNLEQRRALVDLYLHHHRPAVVSESLHYSLKPAPEQVEDVVIAARRRKAIVAVSADLAPAYVSPWRQPTLTVVYVDSPLDLTASKSFVPAMARGEATLMVRHVSDESLLDPWTSKREFPFAVVHPMQQVWDLHDLGGEDRQEAADRIVNRVLNMRST